MKCHTAGRILGREGTKVLRVTTEMESEKGRAVSGHFGNKAGNIEHDGEYTRVGTLIVATIYLQMIQNRYMFRSFTVLQCSHQHCVQPVASDVEIVGYL